MLISKKLPTAAILLSTSLCQITFAQSPSAATPTSEASQPQGQDAPAAPAEQPADAAQPAEPDVDPYAEAKERVSLAEKLYEDGNYDAALTEFQRAYDTMVGHPARGYVLFNVGKCQEKLYRYDAAIKSYKEYLTISAEDADDRATVEAKIELLAGLLGTLIVNVNAEKGEAPKTFEIWVDGRLIGENLSRFSVPGGNHQVEVRAEGFEPGNQEVQIPARTEKSISFSLSPLAKEYKGLSSTYFWTSSGLAVATAITGTAFGVMTVSKRKKLDAEPPESISQEDADKVQKSALMADVFFISAGVFATTSVILAFMTDWSGDTKEAPVGVGVKEAGFYPIKQGGVFALGGSF